MLCVGIFEVLLSIFWNLVTLFLLVRLKEKNNPNYGKLWILNTRFCAVFYNCVAFPFLRVCVCFNNFDCMTLSVFLQKFRDIQQQKWIRVQKFVSLQICVQTFFLCKTYPIKYTLTVQLFFSRCIHLTLRKFAVFLY